MLGAARRQHTAMLGSDAPAPGDDDDDPAQPGLLPAGATVMDRGRSRRPSVFDVIKSRVGTTREAHQFRGFAQATSALYGAILFWVGAWSLIDDQINGVEFLLPQHLKDAAIGALLLVLSDTFYQVGFVYGSLFPPVMSQFVARRTQGGRAPAPRWLRALCFAVVQLRIVVGLFGSVFLWNGVYNALYYAFPEDWIMERLGQESLLTARFIKLTSCIAVGVSLVLGTGTMLVASGVPHVLRENEIAPAWGTPLRVHLKALVIATLSTLGQALTWFGVYEICMTWCPDQDPGPTPDEPQCQPLPSQNAWKPIALLFIGLALFFATDAFVSAAFLDDSQQQDAATPLDGTTTTLAAAKKRQRRRQRRTAMLYFRALAGAKHSSVFVLLCVPFASLEEEKLRSFARSCFSQECTERRSFRFGSFRFGSVRFGAVRFGLHSADWCDDTQHWALGARNIPRRQREKTRFLSPSLVLSCSKFRSDGLPRQARDIHAEQKRGVVFASFRDDHQVLIDEVFMSGRFGDCSYFGTYEGGISCAARNLGFTGLGYLVLLLSNSAAGNAGVEKSYDLTPTPVLHVAGDRTKLAVTSLIRDRAEGGASGAGDSSGTADSGASGAGGGDDGGSGSGSGSGVGRRKSDVVIVANAAADESIEAPLLGGDAAAATTAAAAAGRTGSE
jgi:uncharacterized membrane protein YgcG